jgi:hypothetical protein
MSGPRATPSAQARALEGGNGRAPAPTDEELRALLPAIEPERRVSPPHVGLAVGETVRPRGSSSPACGSASTSACNR